MIVRSATRSHCNAAVADNRNRLRGARSLPFCLAVLVLAQIVALYGQAGEQGASDARNLIHFGDLIDIDVIGSFEYDWRGGLTPEGFLDGLDIAEKPIYALCRSEDEVAADVRIEFGRILRDPNIVVRILDRSNRPLAYLDGAVRTPTKFQLKRPAHLNELLVLAGGITDTASGDIRIFRRPDLNCRQRSPGESPDIVPASQSNSPKSFTIKISELLGGSQEANPEILSGDVVTVVQSLPIYVIGGVNNPRQIASRVTMSVSRAVSSAGGIAKDGLAEEITIYRTRGTGGPFEVDLNKIRAGSENDVLLEPYDIVDVGVKGRAKRKFPPVIENLPGAGGQLANLPLRIVD